MARYTREEILHLRQSPIIVFHTPPLPDWISSDAIFSSQAKTAKSSERQTLSRNPQGTVDDLPAGSTLKSSKGERGDLSGARSGRAAYEKDKSERSDERERPRRGDRDRSDRADFSSRLSRDPRRPEDADENFGSRRPKKPLSDLATFGRRRVEGVDEIPSRTAASTAKSTGPEWMSTEQENLDDDDDARGKTVDDFERWKQSMRKNDGSGDTGLPPLPKEESMSEAIEIKDEIPIKDVKPPPGFGSTSVRIAEGSTDAHLLNSLFGNEPEPPSSEVIERPATLPPGLSAMQTSTSSNVPTTFSGNKSAGSSKFSKFFNQSQDSASSARENTTTPAGTLPRESAAALLSSALANDTSRSGNSDDAAGFERILAMLSSQSTNNKTKGTNTDQGRPEQVTHSAPKHSQPQAQATRYGGQFERPLPSTQFEPMPPPHHGKEHHSNRGYSIPEPGVTGFNPSFDPAQYSPERHYPSNSREDHRNPPSSIMNHHTQNQDFFSSLLKQSGPPFAGLGRPQEHFGPQKMSQSPPSAQQSPPSQRDAFMHRDAYPAHGPPHVRDDHHLHYLRQQQAAQHAPQISKHGSNGRDPAELDFLNKLMQEQRINSGPRDFEQYQSQVPGHGPAAKSHFPPQRPSGQPAYLTGIGSQPGPGWNGQYDIDPRIPNGGQYRP